MFFCATILFSACFKVTIGYRLYASWKRYFLSEMTVPAFHICGGSVFQSLGAELLKARAPTVENGGLTRKPAEEEWREWEAA